MAVSTKEQVLITVYVPESNAAKPALVEELTIILVASLASLVGYLHGYTSIPPFVNRLAEVDQDNSQLSRRVNTASDVDGNSAVDGHRQRPGMGQTAQRHMYKALR
jgi:predicted ATPase with chaperone activity